jgi:hypothetical protein
MSSNISSSISIPKLTAACVSCNQIINVTDDDIVYLASIDGDLKEITERVRYCAKCIDKRKDIPRSKPITIKEKTTIVNRHIQRIINEEVEKKKHYAKDC